LTANASVEFLRQTPEPRFLSLGHASCRNTSSSGNPFGDSVFIDHGFGSLWLVGYNSQLIIDLLYFMTKLTGAFVVFSTYRCIFLCFRFGKLGAQCVNIDGWMISIWATT